MRYRKSVWDLMEQGAPLVGDDWRNHPGDRSNIAERSIAISLKRIADVLERIHPDAPTSSN